LAKSARQRLKILLARQLPSYALAAMLKHAYRGPPITGGVGGSGNGHGRINASSAALIRARPFLLQLRRVLRRTVNAVQQNPPVMFQRPL
jgi:hypothetical protein